MIIGFTGTQKGMTDWQKKELAKLLKLKQCSELAHGEAIGADAQATYIAIMECNVSIFSIFPSTLDKKRLDLFKRSGFNYDEYNDFEWEGKKLKVKWHRPKAALERNKDIVNYSSLLIAAPKEHQHSLRSGTWATIRYCWKIKKDVIIIPPMERDDDEETRADG